MSEESDKDSVRDSPPPGVLDDAEACKGLDQAELTARVRCVFSLVISLHMYVLITFFASRAIKRDHTHWH